MFGLWQLMLNIFGADRQAFRAYVLMPVRRKDILIGKNLSVVPFGLSMMVMLLAVIQVLVPLSFTHFIATFLQATAAFVLACLIGNFTSILAPIAISGGSMKPFQPKIGPALLHGFAIMLAPICFLPGFAGLGAETLLAEMLEVRVIPVY